MPLSALRCVCRRRTPLPVVALEEAEERYRGVLAWATQTGNASQEVSLQEELARVAIETGRLEGGPPRKFGRDERSPEVPVSVARQEAEDRGVIPDHRVASTVADLLAGRDRPLETALTLFTGAPTPPRQAHETDAGGSRRQACRLERRRGRYREIAGVDAPVLSFLASYDLSTVDPGFGRLRWRAAATGCSSRWISGWTPLPG